MFLTLKLTKLKHGLKSFFSFKCTDCLCFESFWISYILKIFAKNILQFFLLRKNSLLHYKILQIKICYTFVTFAAK